jgi:Skp family chaperone for outer membrane proteins
VLAGAAAVVAVLTVMAFEQTAPKVGNVDLDRVVRESKVGKEAEGKFNTETRVRNEILQHFDLNRCYDEQQQKEVADLWLKTNRTPDEEKRLGVLKDTGLNMQKELLTYSQKTTPLTPEEKTRFEDLQRRASMMSQVTLRRMQAEFEDKLSEMRKESLTGIIAKVKVAVQKIGKEQGFTMILDSQYAPYTMVDISDLVLKELDK